MSASDVKILVKNVYVPAETQQFVVVDSLQVRTLKEMIATALPGNPLPKHQKLIFGGKICDDDDTLAKVLAGQNKDAGSSDSSASSENVAPFVFHLMVSSSVPRSRPTTPVARPQPSVEQPAATPAPAPASPAPVPASPAPVPASLPATATPQEASATVGTTPAQPHVAPPPAFPFMGFFGAAPATASPPGTSHHGNHHHLYTQAILMQQQAMILSQIQYLQQLQAHSALPGVTPGAPAAGLHQAHGMFPAYGHYGHPFAHHGYGLPPHPAAAYGHGAHNAHAAAPAFPAVRVPGMQFPGGAVPPAAAPAVAEPRERGPIGQAFREILPLIDIRLAMKMTFMLFIIGQDTPTDRLIVLALMSFGAYLHITGILGKVFELLKRSRGVQGDNGNANGEPDVNNANPDGVVNAQGRLSSIARYVRISSDRGFVHDVRYFITGLLLSLVPAWHPQPLNVDPAAPPHQEPGIAEAAQELPLQGI